MQNDKAVVATIAMLMRAAIDGAKTLEDEGASLNDRKMAAGVLDMRVKEMDRGLQRAGFLSVLAGIQEETDKR